MDLKQALQSLGLNEKEAKIYLACLELGLETVVKIAKKADVKRSTTYVILEELVEQGLISKTPKGKTTLYSAEHPNKLLSSINEKKFIITQILPQLEALNNLTAKKPKIRFYEGEKEIYQVYQEIFKEKEIWYWGSVKELSKQFSFILNEFIDLVKKNKSKILDLLTSDPRDIEYAKKVLGKNYNIKLFPKDIRLNTDAAIFGNKLALISFEPELIAVIIESDNLVLAFRALYQLAWSAATPFTPNI